MGACQPMMRFKTPVKPEWRGSGVAGTNAVPWTGPMGVIPPIWRIQWPWTTRMVNHLFYGKRF